MTGLEMARPQASMENVRDLLEEAGLTEAVVAGIQKSGQAGFQVSWLAVPGSYNRIMVEHRPAGTWAGLAVAAARKQGMMAAEKEEAEMVVRYQEALQAAGLEVVQMWRRSFAPLTWLVVKP
jgi:hypothetical protein